MEEGLATEHDRELLSNTLPSLLDTSGVTNEHARHFHPGRGHIADTRLEVIGNPFHKVPRILAHHFEHLVIHLLARHGTSEHHGAREVPSMTGIGGTHHVLGIKRLLGQLGDREDTEILGAFRGEGGESHEEEVETGEGDHVHRELTEVAVQLTRKAEGAGRPGDGRRDEAVEIAVAGIGEFEGAEANVVEGLVIEGEALIGIFHKLMDRQRGVVWLHHSVRHLWGGHHTVRGHDTIRKFLPNLAHEERPHARSGTPSHGMRNLKSLKHIARLGLLPRHVHDGIHELGTLGVMSLGPIVPRATLAEYKVIGSEDSSEGSGADGVHGPRFEIGEDGAGDVPAGLALVEVDVDALELEVVVAFVGSLFVNSVLLGHYLPEFGSNLVSTLSRLKMNDFSHDELILLLCD
mmetsp:Transcript_29416/g.53353  ORF Transcript_29416/g.53353 Transcript_29416/m.53353 type:complete len:406 (-) Transcript_29416:121-1338(-)